MIQGADLFSSIPPSFSQENTKSSLSLFFCLWSFFSLCSFLHLYYICFFSHLIWQLHYHSQLGINVCVAAVFLSYRREQPLVSARFCGPLLFTECITWAQWQTHTHRRTHWPSHTCMHTYFTFEHTQPNWHWNLLTLMQANTHYMHTSYAVFKPYTNASNSLLARWSHHTCSGLLTFSSSLQVKQQNLMI